MARVSATFPLHLATTTYRSNLRYPALFAYLVTWSTLSSSTCPTPGEFFQFQFFSPLSSFRRQPQPLRTRTCIACLAKKFISTVSVSNLRTPHQASPPSFFFSRYTTRAFLRPTCPSLSQILQYQNTNRPQRSRNFLATRASTSILTFSTFSTPDKPVKFSLLDFSQQHSQDGFQHSRTRLLHM